MAKRISCLGAVAVVGFFGGKPPYQQSAPFQPRVAAAQSIVSIISNPCLRYEPQTVTLGGRLSVEVKSGPPNYGETPASDERIRVAILHLDQPVSVCGDSADIDNSESVSDVREIQLNLANARNSYKQLVGKRVEVTGSLYHSFAGEHFTDVLITVAAIRPDEPAVANDESPQRHPASPVRAARLAATRAFVPASVRGLQAASYVAQRSTGDLRPVRLALVPQNLNTEDTQTDARARRYMTGVIGEEPVVAGYAYVSSGTSRLRVVSADHSTGYARVTAFARPTTHAARPEPRVRGLRLGELNVRMNRTTLSQIIAAMHAGEIVAVRTSDGPVARVCFRLADRAEPAFLSFESSELGGDAHDVTGFTLTRHDASPEQCATLSLGAAAVELDGGFRLGMPEANAREKIGTRDVSAARNGAELTYADPADFAPHTAAAGGAESAEPAYAYFGTRTSFSAGKVVELYVWEVFST